MIFLVLVRDCARVGGASKSSNACYNSFTSTRLHALIPRRRSKVPLASARTTSLFVAQAALRSNSVCPGSGFPACPCSPTPQYVPPLLFVTIDEIFWLAGRCLRRCVRRSGITSPLLLPIIHAHGRRAHFPSPPSPRSNKQDPLNRESPSALRRDGEDRPHRVGNRQQVRSGHPRCVPLPVRSPHRAARGQTGLKSEAESLLRPWLMLSLVTRFDFPCTAEPS
jgi:hypothetical protein